MTILVMAPEIARGGTYFLVSWVNSEMYHSLLTGAMKSWSQHQKLQEEKVGFYKSISQFLTGAMKSWSQHQKLQEEFLYKSILMFMSVLQSSTELAHAGYTHIYIVFCVLLVVLCFIMFLLSQVRSLGRCF